MFLETNSRVDVRNIQELKLSADIDTVIEGQAMASITENGNSVVRPSTGEAGETFVGIALTRLNLSTNRIEVQELAVSGTTITLSHEPLIADDIGVSAAGSQLEAGDPATSGKYSIDGKTITVNAELDGKKVSVRYRRDLTIREAIQFQAHGTQISTLESTAITRSVSVIRTGITFIDNVDLSSAWEDGGDIFVGPNGIFTLEDTGVPVPNARLVAVPTSDVPFLGIEFSTI